MAKKKNIIKRILDSTKDTSLSRVERTFNMLVIFGVIGIAVGAGLSALTDGSREHVFSLLLTSAVFMLILIFANVFHKIKLAINIIAVFITFVALPVNFVQLGGILSGAPILFVFAIVYVCMLVETKIKYLYIIGDFAVFAGSCFLQYNNPEYNLFLNREILLSDIVVTAMFVFIAMSVMIVFQQRIFITETQLAIKQKNDIEVLNIAQTRFFSSMNHEIRTPINTIIGLNEIILREDISKEVAEDTARMQSASRMLLSLVNDILDLSKIDAGKMDILLEPYDTGRMLSEIVDMMWFSAKEKGLDFRLDIEGSIPASLFGDETRIKQVLVNILNNAIKYTPNGSVTFSVRFEKDNDNESMVNAIYSISDTGIGIKEENIPYLFNVFQRVDLATTHRIEGTGLGLSIVKQLVDLMGGTIEVKSVYTKGSTFIVTLPQKEDGEEKIDGKSIGAAAEHELSFLQQKNARFTAPEARILIVDDNEANLLVTEKLLNITQAKIDTASNAIDCLKKTRQERYDIIFMDIIMPGMDGIECLNEMRKQHDGQNMDTPVIALTANAESDFQRFYRGKGFEGAILKPASGNQLEDELLRHLPPELIKKASGSYEINEIVETPFSAQKQKLPLIIATDTAADIPRELVEKNNIILFPTEVETDDGRFLEGLEIDQDSLMRYMAGEMKKVKSIDQTVQTCLVAFPQWLQQAQRVIYINTSSKITTASYPAVCEAARSFPSVEIFDSWQISSGLGLMSLKAAELAKQGMETEEILKELVRLRTIIQTSFIVNDTKYLLAAGRISKIAYKICESLMLHPVITLKKGRMVAGTIKTGTKDVFLKKYIKWALRKPETIDKSIIFITYIGIDTQTLHEIENEIRSKVSFEHIYFQKASASVSANCGPGTFGIVVMRTKRHA